MYANVQVIGGYDHSLGAYLKLVEILKQDFPQANDLNIVLGVTSGSVDMSRMAIAVWSGFLDRGDYPDWNQNPPLMDYIW